MNSRLFELKQLNNFTAVTEAYLETRMDGKSKIQDKADNSTEKYLLKHHLFAISFNITQAHHVK